MRDIETADKGSGIADEGFGISGTTNADTGGCRDIIG